VLYLIPQPQIVRESDKPFCKNKISECRLCMPYEDNRIQQTIKKAWHGIAIQKTEGGDMCVSFGGHVKSVSDETRQILLEHGDSYYISLEKDGAYVFSFCAAGLFYGIATLRQIFENNDTVNCCEIIDYPDIKMRGAYFDLRQSFPKFENLISYIEMLAEFKTNTLMIEYEDIFPFEKHSSLKHPKHSFTDEQFRLVLDTARRNFMEVVPLQQTFGHLEYVLKHEEYMHLRETPDDLGELCPCNPDSLKLSCELIDEIAAKHPDSRYVHLGCDEVWSLGSCETCRERYGENRGQMFIDFVNQLICHVCDLGKKPIIWHDMLGHCGEKEIAKLDNRASVMIWLYEPAGLHKPIAELTKLFRKYNIEVFGACAVRCNDGLDTQNHPKIGARIKNIDAWAAEAKTFEIPFVTATNWATGFAMGTPYGIYETSIYPMYYCGERVWNQGSKTGTFLKRFLKVFHGIDNMEANGGGDNPAYAHSYIPNALEVCNNEDYYVLMQQIAERATRHKDIANLISVIKKFDALTRDFNSASSYLYRYQMLHKQVGEVISLRKRTKAKMDNFIAFRRELKAALERFLPEEMAEMYIAARYFVPEEVYNKIYKKMLDHTI
jgi:hypothetical protein